MISFFNIPRITKHIFNILPVDVPEIVYTSLPSPLRSLANTIISRYIPATIHVGEATLALNKKDPIVSGALTFGVYEKYETKLFSELLKPDMVVVDIGANIGVYTALAAPKVKKVIAIEPAPESLEFLVKTIELNGFSNVRIHRVALADGEGLGWLYLSGYNKGDNRLSVFPEKKGVTEVTLTTLDKLLAGEKVDIIKMDIQGAECLALRGMLQTMKNSPNLKILTEFWPWGMEQCGTSPQEFLNTLKELGFKITPLHGRDLGKLKGREFESLYCERVQS